MKMRIGELAKLTGCQSETVRFYELKGLLPPPVRSQANYRVYDVSHAERLHFIRRCRALGMSLAEIATLLGYQDQPERSCSGVNALVDHQLAEIDRQITELQQLRTALSTVRARCDSVQTAGQCAILRELTDPA
jgi:Cd(II)/Pb(II)-responsive transcriptional regulator